MQVVETLAVSVDGSQVILQHERDRDMMLRVILNTADGRSGHILFTGKEAQALTRALNIYYNLMKA